MDVPTVSPSSNGENSAMNNSTPTNEGTQSSPTLAQQTGAVVSSIAASIPTGAVAAERVHAIWSNVSTSARSMLTQVENTLHDRIHDLMSGSTVRALPTDISGEDISWVCGHREILDEAGLKRLRLDLSNRPRMTYRYGFPPIGETNLTSDSGWGCMIRVGQSLVMEGLVRLDKGKDYAKIASMFYDVPEAPCSIHNLALAGVELDTEVGQWFGPTVMAQAFRKLHLKHLEMIPSIIVAQDAMVFENDIKQVLQTRPTILLIPLRLGISLLHPSYWPFIKECFKSSASIGIAGGRPSSALYMVGSFRDGLLVLDPHTTQPALCQETLSSIHTDQIKCILSSEVDPSLCLGFVFDSIVQWDAWTMWITTISKEMQVPITVQVAPPTINEDMNLSESDSE